MRKKLEMLEELQEIEQVIDGMKTAQNVLQNELNDIDQTVEDTRQEVAGLEGRLARLEQEKDELETTQSVELENIVRSETNMKEIKTNKEFQAVGREITAARKQISEIEEQILQKITQIDELSVELAARKAALGEFIENSAQRSSEKQAEIDKIQQDLDADVLRREALTSAMPVNLINRFTTLRDQRRGRALAIARDGYCMGCNMQLPPQLYNNLYKYEELLTCPHCQRILVLKLQQQ